MPSCVFGASLYTFTIVTINQSYLVHLDEKIFFEYFNPGQSKIYMQPLGFILFLLNCNCLQSLSNNSLK